MSPLWSLLLAAATVFPVWAILRRLGVNPLWSLLCLTGIGLVVLLWYIAFGRNFGERI